MELRPKSTGRKAKNTGKIIEKDLKDKIDFILEEKMINYAKKPSKIYKIENNKMILIR